AVRRHKQWLINTATMEASPASKPGEISRVAKTTTLHGLFLWDGSRVSGDPDDSSDFVREVERFDGYQGEVKIVNLKKTAHQKEPAQLKAPGHAQALPPQFAESV